MPRQGPGNRASAARALALCRDLPEAPAIVDLVLSEGALYILGLRDALRVCRDLLRPGGYLAFTEAVWRKADPPPEVRAIFDEDCRDMGRAVDVVPIIRDGGFELVGHFRVFFVARRPPGRNP